MPANIGADALAGGSGVSQEEVGGGVTGECSAKRKPAVFTAVAAVEGIDVIPPHLEAGVDNVLAVGDDKSVIKLGDGVVKRLRHYRVADVGQCPHARRRSCTTTEAQQKQSGADSVGVGNAQLLCRDHPAMRRR